MSTFPSGDGLRAVLGVGVFIAGAMFLHDGTHHDLPRPMAPVVSQPTETEHLVLPPLDTDPVATAERASDEQGQAVAYWANQKLKLRPQKPVKAPKQAAPPKQPKQQAAPKQAKAGASSKASSPAKQSTPKQQTTPKQTASSSKLAKQQTPTTVAPAQIVRLRELPTTTVGVIPDDRSS